MSVGANAPYRNLGIDGGHELCGEMYNKGIMPHLVVLMGKVRGSVSVSPSCPPPNALHPKLLVERILGILARIRIRSHS